MLRKIRIGISVVIFSLITFYFLDFADILPNTFHVLTHIQFVPALLSSMAILLVLIVLALLFGRIYCSTICPMGLLQDIVAYFSRLKNKKKKRYKYTPAKNILRWLVVGGTTITFLCGYTVVLALLDPYSVYGRIVTNAFRPIYIQGNNILESAFSRFDNYTFYKVDISVLDITSLVIAIITLIIICVMAWKHGRTWCNTICPVGTVLGFLGQFSIFKIRINTEKCNHCGVCGTKCKASCINSSKQKIDHSRCVGCFDCLEACNQQALIYTPAIIKMKHSSEKRIESASSSRRLFLFTGLLTVSAAPNLVTRAKEKVAMLGKGKAYKKETPIIPPGSISREHFQSHCTSCHLCVSKCPSHVLKPAFMEYGLEGVMQPTVYFEKGFCNFDCTICGDICPNGAIKPLKIEQKHLTQIGTVVFIEENCIVYRDGTNCGACSEHCPTQAIAMIPFKDGLTIPHVDTDLCVGCGGCEYVCPARPFRAVHIEGNLIQKQAKPFKEEKKEKVKIDDFGF